MSRHIPTASTVDNTYGNTATVSGGTTAIPSGNTIVRTTPNASDRLIASLNDRSLPLSQQESRRKNKGGDKIGKHNSRR